MTNYPDADDMETIDPIARHQEEWQHDYKVVRDVLYAIRSGAKIEITHDSLTGWEMSGQGLGVFISFDSSTRAANMLLQRLVSCYRQLCAVLGDPDNHRDLRQALKVNKPNF